MIVLEQIAPVTLLDIGADEWILDVGCGAGSMDSVALSRRRAAELTAGPARPSTSIHPDWQPNEAVDYPAPGTLTARAADTHLYGSAASARRWPRYSMMVSGQKSSLKPLCLVSP
jgi:hypothetical protein